jgi:membrane fusion protein (multidrug efflux system)
MLAPVAAVLAVLVAGCAEPPAAEEAREVARNVRVMPLQNDTVTEYLEVAGPVRPVRGTDIASEETGAVTAVDNDKGARVAGGAALVTLDRRLLAAELQAADAAVSLAEYNLDKTQQLHDAGKVSRLELLQVQSAAAEARGRRDVAQTRFDRARITAPFAGIVAERYVEPGQMVMPGMPVARVVDPYVLEVAGSLTESEVAWVREGLAAEVVLEGVGAPVAGEVSWVGFEASPVSGKFPVEIHVDNADLALRPGVIARARLAKRTTDAVVIPRDAVLPGEGVDQVFVVVGDRAEKRRVILGPAQGLMVAVREGLAAGELLVVRGQRELSDGSLVAVTERVAYGDGTGDGDPDVIRAARAGTRVGAEVAR